MKKYFLLVLSALVFISPSFASPSFASTGVTYDEIYHQAVNNCRARPASHQKEGHRKMIRLMIEVEKTFNVPEPVRGMLVAAACSESGYNPLAKGDFRNRKRNRRVRRVPMAIGILQQWPWYEKYYKIDRTDPRQASVSWMQHIVKQLKPSKKRCRVGNNKRKLWVAAWVHAIRAPKKGGRCHETPLHYKLLKKWHRNIAKLRRIEKRELMYDRSRTDEYVPGC